MTMSVAVVSKPQPAVLGVPANARTIYRFSVEQYHRLIEEGILTDNDRVELLHGWVVEKMPQNPPHIAVITKTNRRLVRVLPDQWLLQVQGPIVLGDSEPEPDFAVLRGPEATYSLRKPTPRDVALLIEVADSTLLLDRRDKGLLYALARIPEYWIINIPERRVEVYSRPRAGRNPGYRQQRHYGSDESVPLVLRGREVGRFLVRDLLP
jgi:Uma2 family endonuclease